MRGGRRWRGSIALVAGLALAVLCVGLMLLPGSSAAASELDQARERWSVRPFNDYRLQVVEASDAAVCRQDIQVQGERIEEVLQNQCSHPASWTVPRLFNWIGQLDRSRMECFPSGQNCVCLAAISTSARFHPEFGYPEMVIYEWRLLRNWSGQEYWQQVWWERTMPDCERNRFGGAVTTRVTLTPLP